MPRVPILFAFLVLGACQSRLTGNEGNLLFSYVSDDDVADFNKPVAVNARLDLLVWEVGSNRPVTVDGASFDDPAVLDVIGFSGQTVTVQGVGDGNALLSVEATTEDDDALTDSVNLLARTPEVHRLAHTCASGDTAAYLVQNHVYVPYDFEMTNGQSVIGYGWYPVTAQEGAVTLDEADSGPQFMAFDVGSATASETLVSDVDASFLHLEIVEPSAIDGVQEPIAWVLEDIDVGDVNPFYVRPVVGGLAVCQADTDKTVASDTPKICDVRDRSDGVQGDTTHEYGWFEIEGVSEGTCLYTVTFPAGNGGKGVSAQFSYAIEP
ncbi:MAG: hypothetical protein JXB39_17040 [Deltaproteobacteria bacterium]|nr:hypothetical protein [Deltaproteobacteria bacterium]